VPFAAKQKCRLVFYDAFCVFVVFNNFLNLLTRLLSISWTDFHQIFTDRRLSLRCYSLMVVGTSMKIRPTKFCRATTQNVHFLEQKFRLGRHLRGNEEEFLEN